MRIHIIGGSGTGKSYISKKISSQYQIPHFDLDDVFWDNESLSYGSKMPLDRRTHKLNSILQQKDWVIEGVYYAWLYDSFKLADYIFILKVNPVIFNYRILKRFIKRRLNIEPSKKESLKSLIDLIVWTNKYQKKNLPEIISFLKPFNNKVFIINKPTDILKQIK